jgi:hypothetical protein
MNSLENDILMSKHFRTLSFSKVYFYVRFVMSWIVILLVCEQLLSLLVNTSGKVKIRFSLCLINYAPHHEDIWGSGGIAPPLLTSTLDGGEWLASQTS